MFSWIAEIIFFGAYFIAWLQGAFDTLTAHSSGAHVSIVVSAIAAIVIAVLLLVSNGQPYLNKGPQV